MELSSLTFIELKNMHAQIMQELQSREKEEKAKIKRQVMDLLKAHDLTLEELSGISSTRKPVAPKYVHPEHPDVQWTGRGRQPRWVADLLANGTTLEQLVIRSPETVE